MKTPDKIKLIMTVLLTITHITIFAQRIGYEWIKTLSNSSQVISIIDNENKLIIATNGNIKRIDLDGNLIWEVNDTLFNATGIAVDNENNFYLTGTNAKYINQSQYSFTEISYIYIAKYDKLGNRIWVSTTNIQTTNNSSGNFSTSIACDLHNALYITGSYTSSILFDSYQLTDNNSSAIFIAKYDTAGNAQWAKKIFGTNSSDALSYGQGNEIVIDHENNIYLTGTFRGSFNFGVTIFPFHLGDDLFISKLDSNGVFLKTIVIGSSEHNEGDRLVVDKNNNLILLAKFGDVISINGNQYQAIDNYNNAIIIKLVKDSIIFATQIGYSNGGAIISDICLDKNQNILYVGSIRNWPTLYPMIYRIDTSGIIDWSYMITESTEKNFAFNNSIISDTSGGIYLAGSFNHIAYFGDTLLGSANNLWQTFIGKIDTTKLYPNLHFADNASTIQIFPTITHGNLTIMSLTQNLEGSILYLFNLSGQIIKQFTLTTNKSDINFDEVSSGMYFVQVIGADFKEKFKIIKY